jgi:hypothetical protein
MCGVSARNATAARQPGKVQSIVHRALYQRADKASESADEDDRPLRSVGGLNAKESA